MKPKTKTSNPLARRDSPLGVRGMGARRQTLQSILAFALIIALPFLLTTCEKIDRDNPYDPNTTLNPSVWAPSNLEITVNSFSSITLSWTSGPSNFEGFRIDRKVGTGQWVTGIATLAPTVNTYSDTQVDLTANSYTYRVYAYADNNSSATLEKQVQPTLVITSEINTITHYSAKGGGNVSADEQMTITARGVVWSTNQNPTIPAKEGNQNELQKDTLTIQSDTLSYKGNKQFQEAESTPSDTTKVSSTPIATLTQNGGYTTDGYGTGTWVSDIVGLQPATTYFVRAYSTTAAGTAYGSEQTFTTVAPTLPTLTTNSITSVTATTATSGGNITFDGGAAITARGVVWSTSQNPTTTSNQGITSNGTGTGSFTSNLTGLTPVTTYYVRSYATNSVGTSYGNQQTFTTQDGLPVLTTTSVSSITATTATSGGNITSDGGFAVTARGVVWSTSQNPTTTSNQGITTDGTGIGIYTSNLTSLTANTTYYVRAYSINSAGISYGEQRSFTTLISFDPPTLINPSNGSNVDCCYLYFGWTSVSNALTYELQVSKSSTFTGTLYNLSICGSSGYPSTTGVSFVNVNTTSFCMNTGTSSYNGTWYWRVRAKNDTSTSNWSSVFSYSYTF